MKTVFEENAAHGDATAIDLSHELGKPEYIAMLLLLSDILSILGNLSRTFQKYMYTLNLLSVEGCVNNACDALQSIHDDLFASSYLSTFEATLCDLDRMNTLNHDKIISSAQQYTFISAIIQNLKNKISSG